MRKREGATRGTKEKKENAGSGGENDGIVGGSEAGSSCKTEKG